MEIKIGHGAYSGANALAIVDRKSDAVSILINRGVKRDVARAAVTYVLMRDYGTTIVYGGELGGSLIEVTNKGPATIERRMYSRSLLNRNPDLALDLFHYMKGNWPPRVEAVADAILNVRMGRTLPPPPRVICV